MSKISLNQRLILGLTVVVGVISTVSLYWTLRNAEKEFLEISAREFAHQSISSIVVKVQEQLRITESVVAFFQASEEVTRTEFAAFTSPLLAVDGDFQAISWDPVIGSSQRQEFEQKVRAEGLPSYKITEKNVDGEIVPAEERESYIPVMYLEPYVGNEKALGFDIGSESVRQMGLEHAKASGHVSCTARIQLVQEVAGKFGVLLCAPVFWPAEGAGYTPKGYVVGVVRIHDVVTDAVMRLEEKGLSFCLQDLSASPNEQTLYSNLKTDLSEMSTESTGGGSYAHAFVVGGRNWRVFTSGINGSSYFQVSWAPFSMLISGLLVTLMITNYLFKLMSFNRLLASEVNERQKAEHELVRAHDELELRVADRTKELQEKTKELGLLATDLTLAEEHERRRLAIELHDQIGQTLSLIQMKLRDLGPENSKATLDLEVVKCLDLTVLVKQRVKSMEAELCPSVLYDFGLEEAAKELLDLNGTEHGFNGEFIDDGEPKPLREDSRLILYRSIREILFNVVKYAKAKEVIVSVRRYRDTIEVMVQDDGKGFSPPQNVARREKGGCFGLYSIHEQMSRINGTMEIDSHVGEGTIVTLSAPLDL